VATDLISGASILGDGRVVLIVNLPAMVDRHGKVRPEEGEGIVSGLLLSHADRKTLREKHGGGASMTPVRVLVSGRFRAHAEVDSTDFADRQFDPGGWHRHGRQLRPQEN
jgi:hypothetical protein